MATLRRRPVGLRVAPIPHLGARRGRQGLAASASLLPRTVSSRGRELLRVADGALAVALERLGELGVDREVLGHQQHEKDAHDDEVSENRAGKAREADEQRRHE